MMKLKNPDTIKIVWLARNISTKNLLRPGFRVGSLSGMLFCILNLSYICLGIVMILIGNSGEVLFRFLELIQHSKIVELSNKDKINYSLYTMLGLSTIFIAGTGTLGVKFNYRWLLCVRGIFIMILFHLNSFMVFRIMQHHVFDRNVHIALHTIFNNTLTSRTNFTVNFIQTVFHCCGLDGVEDMLTDVTTHLPYSCCQHNPQHMCVYSNSSSQVGVLWRRGCEDVMRQQISIPLRTISMMTLVVLNLQTICMMTGTTVLLKEISEGLRPYVKH